MSACWLPAPPASPALLAKLSNRVFGGEPRELTRALARLRRDAVDRLVVLVGAGTCGLGAGAGKTLEALEARVRDGRLDAEVVSVGCLGLCSEEPLVDVQLPGRTRLSFARVTADRLEEVLDGVASGALPTQLVLGQFVAEGLAPWSGVPWLHEHPFFREQLRWVLANSGILDPSSFEEYVARGGYGALERALREFTPEAVCDLVIESGLRGRGGGGFPAGRKWKLAREGTAAQRYLICNADEGDPGAFMDRAVCEGDPHALLEGMAIAAYAIGASQAFIYIRAEYPLAVERLKGALAQAVRNRVLGTDILGSGFNLEVALKIGAGAFVCGEETALIHSIEGKRGLPRPRPPYPTTSGLFGQPTVINNVETLANVPVILRHGAGAFAAVGTAKSKGTKVFALSGMVNHTGLVEIPMGTSLRSVVMRMGGGVPANRRCKAVQIGGPSGGCIPEHQLDVPCDYEALKELGAIMGSGGLVVLDERTCMVDLAKYFMEFIQAESCGKCTPCREGTRRLLETLRAITRPRHREQEGDALLRFQGVMQLEHLAEVVKATSLCGLGQTAPNPVLSTLRWFRDEYEAHVFERACPAGSCKELIGAPCERTCPAGTEVWRYVAHVARGEYAEAYRVIREANPFPSVCARVCDHPCEDECRCGTTGGEPIAARALKRFVVDRVEPAPWPLPPSDPARSKRVAVVGAGPSGLTAAHELSRAGHRVTVFERESEPGGMLLSCIPEYRLPRQVVRREIASLFNERLEVRCNQALGRDFSLASLQAQGYDAIYVALGAHRSQRLGIPGEGADGVVPSIEFLKAYNLRGHVLAKGRVGVIGGGNSAMDAARLALRQPGVSAVTLLYRRTRHEMPAYPEEIAMAIDEGVGLETLVTPVAIETRSGAVTGIQLLRNSLGDADSSGRRRPVPIPGSDFGIPLDTLIVAISEAPEVEAAAGLQTSRGLLQVDETSLVTSLPGVFAGGDVIRGPSTVIAAVADGKRAARMIENYLCGKSLHAPRTVKLPTVFVEPVFVEPGSAQLEEEERMPRVKEPELPPTLRARSFAEVQLCISEAAARQEARRCLRCDLVFTRPA